MTKKTKPDCYSCAHRGEVPGSAHSSCKHPKAGGKDPGANVFAILASVGRVAPVVDMDGAAALNIAGHRHGIANGWFNWPFNFDPVWLENCDGFEPIKKPQHGRADDG